jgi:hypothetical protein
MTQEPEHRCPKCGTNCDSVDVGVGIMYGPYGCPGCGWSEDSEYDLSEGKDLPLGLIEHMQAAPAPLDPGEENDPYGLMKADAGDTGKTSVQLRCHRGRGYRTARAVPLHQGHPCAHREERSTCPQIVRGIP